MPLDTSDWPPLRPYNYSAAEGYRRDHPRRLCKNRRTIARVLIVDYGAGNRRSVAKAVERVGYRLAVSDEPQALETADAVIVLGVGSAADTMPDLRAHGPVEPLGRVIAAGRLFLGVCMGCGPSLLRSPAAPSAAGARRAARPRQRRWRD